MGLQLISTVENGALTISKLWGPPVIGCYVFYLCTLYLFLNCLLDLSVKSEADVLCQVSLFLKDASAIEEDLSDRVLQGIAAVLSVANMLLDTTKPQSLARKELQGMP